MHGKPIYTVAPLDGEPGRYHVSSLTRPDAPNLVDLTEFAGNGWCSCEHFCYRLLPKLQRGAQPILECAHIRAAKAHEAKRGRNPRAQRMEEACRG